MTTPTAYLLIGVPAAGKSTWTAKFDKTLQCVHISSDAILDDVAAQIGQTYAEAFDEHYLNAIAKMRARATETIALRQDLIWDQINISRAGRAWKLRSLLDAGYNCIGVVFPTPEPAEHRRRLDNRVGKSIPNYVIQGMLAAYEEPTLSEGFSQLVLADHFYPRTRL